jgi:hypothetical protein
MWLHRQLASARGNPRERIEQFAPHVEIDPVAWCAVERDFERAEASSRKDGSARILRACSRDNADIFSSPRFALF